MKSHSTGKGGANPPFLSSWILHLLISRNLPLRSSQLNSDLVFTFYCCKDTGAASTNSPGQPLETVKARRI